MENEDNKVAPTEEVKVTTEESGSESPHSENFIVPAGKTEDGIVLIPHPSSDPQDPLVCISAMMMRTSCSPVDEVACI
jgi:hypothetical protein